MQSFVRFLRSCSGTGASSPEMSGKQMKITILAAVSLASFG